MLAGSLETAIQVIQTISIHIITELRTVSPKFGTIALPIPVPVSCSGLESNIAGKFVHVKLTYAPLTFLMSIC